MRDQPVAGHQLLASVHARVTRFAAAADTQAVLTPDALVEVTALLDAHASPNTEVLITAGRLRWCRFLAHQMKLAESGQSVSAGAGPGDLDRDAALRLFAQVPAGHADIPAAAWQLLATGVPPPAPSVAIETPASVANDEAAGLLERFETTADRPSLDRAIKVLDRVVEEIPPISAEHARAQALLSYALRLRYGQTGDRESLRRSVHAGRQAAALVHPAEPDLHRYLLNLIDALLTWYELTSEGQHLAEASAVAERLHGLVADADPEAGLIIAVLTQVHYHRYELTGEVAVLAEATRLARECPPQRLAGQAVPLSALGVLLWRWSERTADPADLSEAVAYCRAAHEALPQAALVDRAHVAVNTSGVLVAAYERTGAAEHLAEAITICRAAAGVLPSAEAPQNRLTAVELPAQSQFAASLLTNLCLALRMQARLSGDPATLDEAIAIGRRASAAMPLGHRSRPVCLSNLALAIINRYQATGDQALLAEASEIAEQAMAATPENHPEFFKVLTNLAGMTWQAGKRLGQPAAVLDLAVRRARAAVAAAPPGHQNRPGALGALSVALRARFIRTGEGANIAEAVTHAREAVRLTAPGDLAHQNRLHNLAIVLESHASRTGGLPALREAVAIGREALSAGGPRHPELAADLASLADLLLTLHHATDEAKTLDEAETLIRRALGLFAAGQPGRVSALSTLSSVLADRYGHTGAIEQLHESIKVAREALAAVPAGHSNRAFALYFLAQRLVRLHEVTRQPEVLSEAVGLARLAVSVVPADHPYLVRSLVTISDMLLSRYQPTGPATDAATAVTLLRRALAATRPDDPIRGSVLTDLSIALRAHHDHGGGTAALTEAVTLAQQALDTDDSSQEVRLTALGLALLRRYDRERRVDVLTQATHALQEVIRQLPPDDPRRAQSLFNLGLALQAEAVRVKRKRAAAKAIAVFRESAGLPTARPSTRVRAAQQWGLLAVACRDWQSAANGLDLAVRTLPQVAPAHLGRQHRTDQLAGFAGLAANAAAVSLYAGHQTRAVELLEQGRGVLLGQVMDLHTGLAALRRIDPASANRFTWLLGERDANEDGLDRRDTAVTPLLGGHGLPEPLVSQSHAAQHRHALSEEWGQLVEKIRTRPGFRRFLIPESQGELLEHAADGPIVILNVSQIRSDALVLTDAGLRTIHLPDARPDAVRRQVNAFLEAVGALRAPDGDPEAADRAIDGVLCWLWDSVTGPVLDSLGYHARPGLGEPWPRVWWSPTGMLSLLPLHAAGYHAERGSPRPPTVIDRVVSSYTPTVRALAHARRQLSAVVASPGGAPDLLVVSMPDTPGWPGGALPGAAVETRALRQLFPAATVLTGPAAGRDAVVSGLRTHPWVHFACHSRTDPQGIADSHLMLYDHERRPFTVADIAQLDLAGAQFAFLSACDTARTDQRLPDEAVHISSAFLLAGFGSVVGTLWAIEDDQAVLVTRSVYGAMANRLIADVLPSAEANQSRLTMDPRQAAGALHRASLRARAEHPDSPSLWAAHVHVGA